MSRIKEFYHEEICKAAQNASEGTFPEITEDRFFEHMAEEIRASEDAQILKRAEEMEHSEMPNFFR